jgi:N-formylglutamate amidohydrolase
VRIARSRGQRDVTIARLFPLLAIAAACASSDGAPSGTTPPPPPPPVPLAVSGWVTTVAGTLPLIIVAPHGGDLSPDALPDRRCTGCETANDANTQELAYEVADAFERRVALRPYLVINRLHRRKFDANRERSEATGDHAPLDPMWALFHAQVDSAKSAATRALPRALLIDLHGHAHPLARLELGYLLSATELRLPDSLLGPRVAASSIARLGATAASGDRGAPLVRGARALGTRLDVAGYPAVPSARIPAPSVGDLFFSGGYNTQRHGSLAGGAIDAIQVECNFAGVRDTAANRRAFADVLVTALLAFLDDHYGWRPPA